tara:strand:+ start:621 stop:815 length:195 start_codon:yes stop_codon:yes gene_type:complete
MMVNRHNIDGFTISDFIQNKLGHDLYVKKRYIGYSVSVAKRKFRAYCKEIKQKENQAVNEALND